MTTDALELVNGTGGGTALYQTVGLPNVSLAAGDYFVVCASATTVANRDLDVSPNSNLIQHGAPDAVALVQGATIIDAVSYEGDTGAPYTEGAGAGLEDSGDMGVSRCPDGADTDQNIVDFAVQTISPGATNVCEEPPPPEPCGDEFTPIYAIQGSGLASALDGTEVATEGIVVGDFQDGKSGFFLQDETGDDDAATSDGIFAFSTGPDVNVGDKVRVRGIVDEYFDLTEITNVNRVWQCSTGFSVAPVALSLPVTNLDDFEPFEGMLVTFPRALAISEYFNFDRFGEIVLTADRQFQPAAVYEPGSPEAAQLALENSLSRITLDDGRGSQNPDPAIHPNGGFFTLDNLFRGGDTVQNVTGALDYNFGLYKVQQTQGADYVAANPRTAQPEDVGGNLAAASFNVLNYFTTIDTGVAICGPDQNQDCRSADTAQEFARQRNKIIAALADMDADVVGLIEIENHLFDGQLGYLDHALANADLLAEITGATVWHINADEPDLIDYDMSFKQAAQDLLYASDAYRASDHDPAIAGLNVCDEIAPTAEVSLTPDTLWPVNHKYVQVVATVVAGDNFDPNPTVSLVLVTSSDPEDGLGDGKTTEDIGVVNDYTFNLRAERSGKGGYRVYTVTYEVTDACGNSTLASATVTVPHDRAEGDE